MLLYFMYSQYLGFVCCGILLVLAVFQYFNILHYCENCHTRSILGFDTLDILLYLKYFGVRYSGILSVLEVFKDPVLLILWVLAVFRRFVLPILAILGVFKDFILRGEAILAVRQGSILLLWYGLGRPVITSEIGNWSVFVLFGWHFVLGIIMKWDGWEPHIVRRHHGSGEIIKAVSLLRLLRF